MGRVVGNPLVEALEGGPGIRHALRVGCADAEESDVLAILSDEIGRWAADSLRAAKGQRPFSRDLLRSAGELGLFGMTIPKSHGGAGFRLAAACRAVEEVAAWDPSLAVTLGLHGGPGVRGIVEFGTDELRSRLLPGLAKGDLVAAFCATEAEAGSDLGAIRGVVEAGEKGRLRLSASKLYVTNGGFADVFTVLARLRGVGDRREGLALVVVPRGAPGVSVGPEEEKLGLHGSSTTPVSFADAPIGEGWMLGDESPRLPELESCLAWGRMLLSGGCIGAARAGLARACRHVEARRQFGRRIGEFGQVRRMIADMRASVYAMESVVRLAAAERSAPSSWESCIAKVFCTEAAWRVADCVLQLHGGSGFIESTGVCALLRDARVCRIFEGANEVLRASIGAGTLLHPFDEARARKLPDLVHAGLADPAGAYEARFTELGETVHDLLRRRRSSVFAQQLRLAGLADAAIALYGMLAVVLRTDSELSSLGGGRELRLAHHVTRSLGARVTRGLAAARDDEAEGLIIAISDDALGW